MDGLTPAHKRMWHNRGVKDARLSLSATHIDDLLKVAVNYYLPEHFSDARKYYLIGFRRTGHRLLKREQHQSAGIAV